ncbi:PREDICTED: putative nuclease HARBI1 [Camelina sativa]|uniref:Nuclease HARBI1 n=1 Tax=Camelina sativa TaxID=90675 RepID=A0ABM1RPP7_CAMSA|nr:PREDICTED: putative nuclease HARBI1 [Camelina sativa]XP_019097053.1 PREDICTED: putative nuclease HARBI1 [Camelina sativa]XP_019100985.1 PREDICTED: putative nuclease HARBI1 [Camelina sativa]
MDTIMHPLMEYYNRYFSKQPMAEERGLGWQNLERQIRNKPVNCMNMLRMHPEAFKNLCTTLEQRYNLRSTDNISIDEMVAIFLVTCGQNASQRFVGMTFGRSQETAYRKFHEVLDAVERLACEYLKTPTTTSLQHYPRKLQEDSRYWPFFSGFVGALDGTHVKVMVGGSDAVGYFDRNGQKSLNIMAICDLNMIFKYAWLGAAGSTHDSLVLQYAIDGDPLFPRPPIGKYYLVDSGYANKRGFLAPYRGSSRENIRYHLSEFDAGAPRNKKELYNRWHASLRSVIERTFGVWKKKWTILDNLPRYDVKTQNRIVHATMVLHNFIRLHRIPDADFEDENVTARDSRGRRFAEGELNRLEEEEGTNDGQYMNNVRDEIANMLWNVRRH